MLTNRTDDRACRHPLRGGGTCAHDAGHRGRHSSTVFRCDGCGKTRRGVPHAQAPDDATGETFMEFCFMCSAEQVINPHGLSWEDR